MIQYFNDNEFINAKKQKRRTLIVYFVIFAIYAIISTGLFLWFRTLPYMSEEITKVKIIHHVISVIFIIFSFIYLGIKYKRVKKFFIMTLNMKTGIKETFTGSFFEYDENVQQKDGVDFKALIFLEWNKYKEDFFERKVLIPFEKEFPKFEENQNVKYITQGNVLYSYEILS